MSEIVILDIKGSAIELVKARLAGNIAATNFFRDPPRGEYTRPIFYLTFKDRKRNPKKSMFGSLVWDYALDATIEVAEDAADDSLDRVTLIERAFTEGERFAFYHFVDSAKYLREGEIEVTKFMVQEANKDRVKNRITSDLILTF